ncbi:nitroreductase family protein [Bifidobacterium sp.]|jgi:nitroreductase|uniref:nitroreductase family protein n=1 Tax=Bifidobacterium sp. TaxID=41200 RepID=UPI0025C1F755|nr:nitroreductase family protein [Bifidobacterium sp.]MCI1634734.1 nitroreductase family protein [Bifidobacterium sp.]
MSTSTHDVQSPSSAESEFTDNPTVQCLLHRRSIRHFKSTPIDDKTVDMLQTVAQHAATSQYLNSWSAIRISNTEVQHQLADIGHQTYIAEAPLLYIFVVDQHRNMRLAAQQGIDTHSSSFTLNSSYIFTQSQNDAVLALHAMETAANAIGLGCVILGSVLNDIDRIIDLLHLPALTFPVLGLAIGEPDQEPALKPRLPQSTQFFENHYPDDENLELLTPAFEDFNEIVHQYYDLRDTSKTVPSFSNQIAHISQSPSPLNKCISTPSERQGFTPQR